MTDPMSDFEPNEEYEQSNSRNLSVGLTMLFIGLAAG